MKRDDSGFHAGEFLQGVERRVGFIEAVDMNEIVIAGQQPPENASGPGTARKNTLDEWCEARVLQSAQQPRVHSVEIGIPRRGIIFRIPDIALVAAALQAGAELLHDRLDAAKAKVFIDQRDFHRPAKARRWRRAERGQRSRQGGASGEAARRRAARAGVCQQPLHTELQ